jgi:hypothetical protein
LRLLSAPAPRGLRLVSARDVDRAVPLGVSLRHHTLWQ